MLSADERTLFLGGTNGLFRFALDEQGAASVNGGRRVPVTSDRGREAVAVLRELGPGGALTGS